MAARRVAFRAFWGRQRRLTMSRIAGATLPAQKTRKDDHTYHPFMLEGTRPEARRDDAAVREAVRIAVRSAFRDSVGQKPLTTVHVVRL